MGVNLLPLLQAQLAASHQRLQEQLQLACDCEFDTFMEEIRPCVFVSQIAASGISPIASESTAEHIEQRRSQDHGALNGYKLRSKAIYPEQEGEKNVRSLCSDESCLER